jgi:hypothetical protein
VEELASLLGHGVGLDDECVEWGAGVSNKYGSVNIRLTGGRKTSVRIHRAMREIVEGESDLEVLHSCGNKLCFRLEHTRYGTQSENVLDRYRLGETRQFGETHSQSRLTQAQVDDIRQRHVKGNRWRPSATSATALAQEYGVAQSVVSLIVRGKAWAR